MTANSSSSFLISLTLHAFVVALIFLGTFVISKQVKEAPVIFELVAGPPSGQPELEAPALGNTKIKIDIPKIEQVPTMPEPEPEPEAAPARPTPKEVAPPPPAEKPKPKTQDKPKPDTSMSKELKKSQRMSYSEYMRKHPTPKQTAGSPSSKRPTNVPRVDATGIAQGVKGGSINNTRGGEGGKALSREQQNQMNTYISLLIQELKRAHEPPAGVSDRLEAKVTFDITASGAIMNPRISKSSGDKAFDESVLDAFLRMRSIGPTPNRRSDTWTVTFRMRDEA